MDEFKKYDRVALVMDFKVGDRIIPEGTIGTYRTVMSGGPLVQLNIPGDANLACLPDTLLRLVEAEELNSVNPEGILPGIYHPGNVWSVQIGYDNLKPVFRTGEIIAIKLAANESRDKIRIRFYDDSTEKEYEKRFLENHGSYMPAHIPEYAEETQEERENG